MDNGSPVQEWYKMKFRNSRVRDHYNPFSNYILFGKYFLLVYGSMISVLDTENKQWIEHKLLDSQDTGATFMSSDPLDKTDLSESLNVEGVKKTSAHTVF